MFFMTIMSIICLYMFYYFGSKLYFAILNSIIRLVSNLGGTAMVEEFCEKRYEASKKTEANSKNTKKKK